MLISNGYRYTVWEELVDVESVTAKYRYSNLKALGGVIN